MTTPKPLPKRLDMLQFLKQATTTAQCAQQQQVTGGSQLPRQNPQQQQPVYVLGNPSADLDSMISAIVYAYFATTAAAAASGGSGDDTAAMHVPVINLPNVPSGRELARLRPELVTALRLAGVFMNGTRSSNSSKDEDDEKSESEILRESILTIAGLREVLRGGGGPGSGPEGQRRTAHDGSASSQPDRKRRKLDAMMVDWNAMPRIPSSRGENVRGIEGISDVYDDIDVAVVGCIDHHDDEAVVPKVDDLPSKDGVRCIQTGVGSCTSLVVRELRARGLWPEWSSSSSSVEDGVVSGDASADINQDMETSSPQQFEHYSRIIYESQAAKLALAAILIDTANMTAESKVSDIDRAAVSFLENKIQQAIITSQSANDAAATTRESQEKWDREAFYAEIKQAKENSVENLTMDEIIGRDYKEWTDSVESSDDAGTADRKVKIGICCVVKPLSWILQRTNTPPPPPEASTSAESTQQPRFHALREHLHTYARAHELDIVALMTVYTDTTTASQQTNGFYRELIVDVVNGEFSRYIKPFEERAVEYLGLEDWTSIPGIGKSSKSNDDGDRGYMRVWRQGDVTKSRKQVAPLLRSMFSGKQL
ncbi:hypothetical protein AJ80_01112 [Polytolypa hystricis UAMH7299]|uniref:DHHA2 domain-containing protein n=1 Tax=Polytolypa hystricis (strain UAMH7299) TaxID=1447883 RepID=A0A2B7YZP5_POLH7|nr:hypothetical protein AJ80_01112 [Polytolypa hystricis UAMH7299]